MNFKSLLPCIAVSVLVQFSASAQTIQASATKPTPGPNDIFNFSTVGALNGGQDYSNNAGHPGESFTTANAVSSYNLNSVTVQGNGDAGTVNNLTYQGATYTLTLYSVAAGAATTLRTQNFTFADQTTATNYSNSYLTFTLATPLVLTANTQYAYAINATQGFYGFAGSGAAGGVTTTGGQAVGITAANAVTSYAYSRNFDLGITPAPEPGALALSAVGLVALVFVWKRRSTVGVA